MKAPPSPPFRAGESDGRAKRDVGFVWNFGFMNNTGIAHLDGNHFFLNCIIFAANRLNPFMKHRIELNWLEDMAFSAEVNDHRLTLDADEMVGGENRGPRPKPLMLAALAGCTAMDVVSILKKMKQEPDDFSVAVEAELTDEHPKQYSSFHIIYQFRGEGLDPEKLEKAINLSQEKYCGVSAMYREFATITHEIRLNP